MSWWIRIINILLRPWPRHWVRALGRPLGVLWFDILRFRRSVVMNNLKIAFPEWSEAQRVEVGRRSVYMLAENLAEFFLIPSITEEWIEHETIIHGEENLKEALKIKRGALLLTLHLAHGDILANIVARKGYNVNVITKFFKSQWLNNLWFAIRGAQGVKFIEPHGEKTPFAILKALRANGLVAFVLDQHMGRPYGIEARFFNRPVGTAYGLALFQLKTKAPIVLTYSYEGEDGKIHVVFDRPLFHDESLGSRGDRDQSIRELTQIYTDKLEEVVRRYPKQWMWVHRRWKWKG